VDPDCASPNVLTICRRLNRIWNCSRAKMAPKMYRDGRKIRTRGENESILFFLTTKRKDKRLNFFEWQTSVLKIIQKFQL